MQLKKQHNLLDKTSLKLVLFTTVLILSLISQIPNSAAQYNNGMPDWTKSVEVGDHYILITQVESGKLEVEELIWFENMGTENFTDKLFVWSPQSSVLEKITQAGFVINEKLQPSKVYPSTHSPNFLFLNLTEENITIAPGGSLEVAFKYILSYDSVEDMTFTTTFLYTTENVIVIIETQDDYAAEGRENIALIYDQNSKTYITSHSLETSKELGDSIAIGFKISSGDSNGGNSDNGSSSDKDYTLIYIAIVIIVGLVISLAVRTMKKKKDMKARKKVDNKKKKKKDKKEED